MVYGGQGLGRIGGKVVFVPFTAPGDRVQVETIREKKGYAEARLKSIEKNSPWRVRPFCRLFGECGGCHFQHLSYPQQLRLKEETLRELLPPLMKKGNYPEILPAMPSPHDRGYRIRAQFKAGQGGGKEILGFYSFKTHRLVEVEECPLLHPLLNHILQGLRAWVTEKKRFSLKGADIQGSPEEGRGVIRLRVEGKVSRQIAEELGKGISGVKGVVVEGRQKVSWGDLTLLYQGPKILGRESLRMRARYDSFTQVNPYQNWNLVIVVVEWAKLTGREKVFDLFCGSGNLTLPLAQQAMKVWGVDQDRRAVENAVENARGNKLLNCTFLAARAADGITRVLQEAKSVDLAILDPPRSGAKDVLGALALLQPEKILYISCEPPTLARDLTRLEKLGYYTRQIQPLDMFPQTYHIEVIAEVIKNRV